MKPNCPLLKEKRNKFEKSKKALKAKTSNNTECKENDEEYTNICLMAYSESEDKIEESNSDIPREISNYIDELCSNNKAALRKISKSKKENLKLKQQDLFQKERIETLEKDLSESQESQDLVLKENKHLKKEVSNVMKIFSIGSKSLEHILSIQITYYKEFGLGCKISNDLQNDFPRIEERIKQRPLKILYKIICKAYWSKCSTCENPDHFENDCPKG